MHVLHVVANPKPEAESACKRVSRAFFGGLQEQRGNVEVTVVDLYEDPPPYYSYGLYRYYWWPIFQQGYQPTDDERAEAAYSSRQGKLFNEADVLAITAPMWNFAVPAVLKAWMDQVLSPGLTFTVGPDGVAPRHKIRTLVLMAASGGVYDTGDERDNFTHQIAAAFGFVGITQMHVAWADGQNPFFFADYEERLKQAMARAHDLGREVAKALREDAR